jgi:hypothetical protein
VAPRRYRECRVIATVLYLLNETSGVFTVATIGICILKHRQNSDLWPDAVGAYDAALKGRSKRLKKHALVNRSFFGLGGFRVRVVNNLYLWDHLCRLHSTNKPVPAWTEEPEYFLPEIWDPWTDMDLDMKEFEEERKAKSHECFLKRNVIFASRDLITL